MSPKDGTSDEPSAHEVDPLSATGMFLSALGAESRPPLQRAPDVFAEPLPKSTAIPPADAERPQAFPGEFTRLFQAAEPSHPAPVQRFPRQTNAPGSELDPAAANSPGEFTRIFVKPPEHAPAPPAAKATPRTESVSKPASAMPRLRGYSSGVSDSASADGTLAGTAQLRPSDPFAAPRVPASAPAPPVSRAPQSSTPQEEFKWTPQSEPRSFDRPAKPLEESQGSSAFFASPDSSRSSSERVNLKGSDPLASFYSSRPGGTSAVDEPGGVTRLIQKLSEDVRVLPRADAPPAVPEVAAPSSESFPGEFTRMISKSSVPGGSAVSGSASLPVQASAPPLAAPVIAPPAIQVPSVTLPQPPAPKMAPPVAAAPPGKFQAMVPILLVVNTFLLLVLIVLVIFALKAR